MGKKKLLLHSCCGPCSTSVVKRLMDEFDVTVLFCNNNMCDSSEYEKRFLTQMQAVSEYEGIKVIDYGYNQKTFLDLVEGLEKEKEGGSRCEVCFRMRLSQTCIFAKQNGYDIFATTLSVSPHKNCALINQIGQKLQSEYGIEFLVADFKKKDGYLESTRISKRLNLYRQTFCGCKFSKPKEESCNND